MCYLTKKTEWIKTRGKRETDIHSLICRNRPAKSSSAGKAFSLLIDDIYLSPGDLTLDEASGRTSCRHAWASARAESWCMSYLVEVWWQGRRGVVERGTMTTTWWWPKRRTEGEVEEWVVMDRWRKEVWEYLLQQESSLLKCRRCSVILSVLKWRCERIYFIYWIRLTTLPI